MVTKNILQDINKGLEAAKAYCQPIHSEGHRNLKLYLGRNPKKKYKSEANFHVPYTATLCDNILPILTARKPFAKIEARNPERDYRSADNMNELLEYTYDVNNFDYAYSNWVKESMFDPIVWLKVTWEFQDAKTDHPKIEGINAKTVFVHPRKIALDDRWPIYQVCEMTKAQMIEMGWDKRAINLLGKSKLQTADYRRQQLKAMGLSAQEPETDDLYEVVECWGKFELEEDKEELCFFVVANGEKLINLAFKGKKKYQSPYDHEMLPFVPLVYNKIPHIFHGEPAISRIASQQEELNALENMKADNYKRRNNPPLQVRRSANVDLSTLKFVNSVPWLVNEPDDITPVIVPDLAPSIDNQQAMIKAVMQNALGANDVLLVSDTVNIKGGDTAAGAAIANENTKLRFKPQADLIDNAIKRVGELVIGLFQQPNLFDRKKTIAITGKEGELISKDISPADIKGDLVYRVQSASTLAESSTNKLTKLLNIKQLYIEDQTINQEELDKQIFLAADLDYESVKRDQEELGGDLVMQLKRLVMMAKAPGFKQQPAEVQNKVMTQIQNIKLMIQGGGQPEQPMGQGQMTEDMAGTQ